MIQLVNNMKENGNVVFVLSSKNKGIVEVPAFLNDFVKAFEEGKKEEDFAKVGSQYFFFVKENENLEKMRLAGNSVRKQLDKKADNLTIVGNGASTLALVEGFMLSNYQFLKYFKEAEEMKFALSNVEVKGDFTAKQISDLNNTVKAVYWARTMVNEPVSFLNATQLATEIEALGKEANFSVKVLGRKEIEDLKMGGLLAVNKGSIDQPTFTIMEYKPANPINKKPIVLVGKGVVYDTGGLSLKPTAGSMDSMKSDMGGAACMAGTIYAAALNDVNVHVIGLVPATDNRPGGNAYAPGDVITMFDGTTIEVLNTDAEGRMILADAIAYATKYDPEVIIDAATLTGAALVVAGDMASCIMGNDEQTIDAIIASGYNVHERLAKLPFWDDYKDLLKSNVADMKNIGGRFAGTITAGKFLEHFAKAPYVHMDIAGPAWMDAPRDYKGNGGTGSGVRTLVDFLTNYKG
ncbi:leucyl aminopeptidase family protein [Myroides odoratimimus]|uniref:leucyl aminopeptidase family protein n=1 Tax=Myroides odoratimimus TaxID=76832 RepID=UPI00217F8E70|nr:leucyl aminopeptidase [Myroides odoratimimus]MCS7474197.1 leucyl aminopeptidase [Myroides odoratimimus]MDM1035638.1 leucyl aminopeptidase [Myroides odoratimimus]MDM1037469.1 leucyl aminopeptidase [Myroides odoratimimus]MDM1051453.1 leucyl aminopeptidase [Myroides odoratimimus]MDM1459260.1 leucyl aminopeptidase [Myroides odoratimimus]